jgi:hypothetical protein
MHAVELMFSTSRSGHQDPCDSVIHLNNVGSYVRPSLAALCKMLPPGQDATGVEVLVATYPALDPAGRSSCNTSQEPEDQNTDASNFSKRGTLTSAVLISRLGWEN